MAGSPILGDEFSEAARLAVGTARRQALAEGHSLVFFDAEGRCVEERPDGRRFEVYLDPAQPRERHRVVLRELPAARP